MRGSGTITDPYMIETWSDFFSTDVRSLSVYAMLANDLDGNDHNNGLFALNNYMPYNLDGNGHTIRNIYYHGDYSGENYVLFMSGGGNWKNLTLENIDVGVVLFDFGTQYQNFQNCKISVNAVAFQNRGVAKFIDSCASLKVVTQKSRCEWLRSHGRIEMVRPTYVYSVLEHIANTSRLEINVLATPSGTATSLNPLKVANSVLAISLPEDWDTVTKKPLSVKGDPLQPSVMDSTLLRGNSTSQITDVILLPTEDMKNADKLNAAGFLVERVY